MRSKAGQVILPGFFMAFVMGKIILENVKITLDFNALKCYTLTERTAGVFFFMP